MHQAGISAGLAGRHGQYKLLEQEWIQAAEVGKGGGWVTLSEGGGRTSQHTLDQTAARL